MTTGFKTALLFSAAMFVAVPASAQIGGDLPSTDAPVASDAPLPEREVAIETSNPTTEQTDRSEERWRRSRKRRGSDDIFDSNSANTGLGGALGGTNPYQAEPIDTLPAESRRHLLRQRAAMIAGAGEKYKPSDAALEDPALQEQEKEIWEAMKEDMKQREAGQQSGQQGGQSSQQGRRSQSRSAQRQAQQQGKPGKNGKSSPSMPGMPMPSIPMPGLPMPGLPMPGLPGIPSGMPGTSGPRGGSSGTVGDILGDIKGTGSSGGGGGSTPGTGRGQGSVPQGGGMGGGGMGGGGGSMPAPPSMPGGGGGSGPQAGMPSPGGSGGPLGDNPFGGLPSIPGIPMPTVQVGNRDDGSESARDRAKRDRREDVGMPGVRVAIPGDPAERNLPTPGNPESDDTPPIVVTAGIPGDGNGEGEGEGSGDGSGNGKSLGQGDRERGFGAIAGPNGAPGGMGEGTGDGIGEGTGMEGEPTGMTPPAPPSAPTTPVSDPSVGPLERAKRARTEGPARGNSSASDYLLRGKR